MKREYHPHKPDTSEEEVNFDLVRMKKAVEEGQRFVMPEGMKRENFRDWMRENNDKCQTR
jgi:hypothetical protein